MTQDTHPLRDQLAVDRQRHPRRLVGRVRKRHWRRLEVQRHLHPYLALFRRLALAVGQAYGLQTRPLWALPEQMREGQRIIRPAPRGGNLAALHDEGDEDLKDTRIGTSLPPTGVSHVGTSTELAHLPQAQPQGCEVLAASPSAAARRNRAYGNRIWALRSR